MSSEAKSPKDDGVKEVFPVRMNTTSNVTDFRPVREDPDAPEADDELGKVGVDAALASASSEGSATNSELPTLTTGVQIPASKESTPKAKK